MVCGDRSSGLAPCHVKGHVAGRHHRGVAVKYHSLDGGVLRALPVAPLDQGGRPQAEAVWRQRGEASWVLGRGNTVC